MPHNKDEQNRLLLLRIKLSDDGKDFINFLEELSYDNYRAWKEDDADMNEQRKGMALAIDSLLESFAKCGKEPETKDVDPLAEAHY